MKHQVVIVLVLEVCGALSVLTLPCAAQTLSAPTAPNQAPQSQQSGPQPSSPSAGAAATTNAGGTSLLTPAPTSTPTAPTQMVPSAAGRGLPGMPAGPPLNRPMGAQDPAPTYMRPTVIGPLECDLTVDPACL